MKSITFERFVDVAPRLPLPGLSRRLGRDRRYLDRVLQKREAWTPELAEKLTALLDVMGIELDDPA